MTEDIQSINEIQANSVWIMKSEINQPEINIITVSYPNGLNYS